MLTLTAFLTPLGILVLLTWSFAVLSAAQLTIRLIMVFSLRQTLRGAIALTAAALLAAATFDIVTGPESSYGARLEWVWLPIAMMAVAGFATARWVLGFRRPQGQLVCALMVGVLAPHPFALATPVT